MTLLTTVQEVKMIITLHLGCNDLMDQKAFFDHVLKCETELSAGQNMLTVNLVKNKIIFTKSEKSAPYHYCFLIPTRKLKEAKSWLSQRQTIVEVDEQDEFFVEDWNAPNIYFFDGDQNIIEFIEHPNMGNETDRPFDESQILCVNEIGLVGKDIPKFAQILSNHGIEKFSGNELRFAAYGKPEGMFILLNNTNKKTWFPTQIFPEPVPFECTWRTNNDLIQFIYDGKKLSTNKMERV